MTFLFTNEPMNTAFFIAKRIFGSRIGKISPIARRSVIGVALSVSVMLIAVSVTQGFKHNVRSFASHTTGDICIAAFGTPFFDGTTPITLSPRLRAYLKNFPGIASVNPVAQIQGVVKTKEAFEGVLLLGSDSTYDRQFYEPLLSAGRLPAFTSEDSVSNPLVLPEHICRRLDLKIGDRVHLYFIGDRIRLRPFTLVGEYRTTGNRQSAPLALCNINTVRRIHRWAPDQVSRISLMLDMPGESLRVCEALSADLSGSNLLSPKEKLGLSTAAELSPTIYAWLDMLDTNVYILLALMALVAGFTMIACLAVLVLDKVRLIGIIKALGAPDIMARHIFLFLAGMLVTAGLALGNFIALTLCLIQRYSHLIRLDRDTYYMDHVPVFIDLRSWLIVNLGAFILILVMLLGPVHIVNRIRPTRTMQFD